MKYYLFLCSLINLALPVFLNAQAADAFSPVADQQMLTEALEKELVDLRINLDQKLPGYRAKVFSCLAQNYGLQPSDSEDSIMREALRLEGLTVQHHIQRLLTLQKIYAFCLETGVPGMRSLEQHDAVIPALLKIIAVSARDFADSDTTIQRSTRWPFYVKLGVAFSFALALSMFGLKRLLGGSAGAPDVSVRHVQEKHQLATAVSKLQQDVETLEKKCTEIAQRQEDDTQVINKKIDALAQQVLDENETLLKSVSDRISSSEGLTRMMLHRELPQIIDRAVAQQIELMTKRLERPLASYYDDDARMREMRSSRFNESLSKQAELFVRLTEACTRVIPPVAQSYYSYCAAEKNSQLLLAEYRRRSECECKADRKAKQTDELRTLTFPDVPTHSVTPAPGLTELEKRLEALRS